VFFRASKLLSGEILNRVCRAFGRFEPKGQRLQKIVATIVLTPRRQFAIIRGVLGFTGPILPVGFSQSGTATPSLSGYNGQLFIKLFA
jgi:hypothetical protein